MNIFQSNILKMINDYLVQGLFDIISLHINLAFICKNLYYFLYNMLYSVTDPIENLVISL